MLSFSQIGLLQGWLALVIGRRGDEEEVSVMCTAPAEGQRTLVPWEAGVKSKGKVALGLCCALVRSGSGP